MHKNQKYTIGIEVELERLAETKRKAQVGAWAESALKTKLE